MSVTINDQCISCGACALECPVEALSEGPEIYTVNPDACCECVGFSGILHCKEVCPTLAISIDEKASEPEAALLKKALESGAETKVGSLEELSEATSHFRKKEPAKT